MRFLYLFIAIVSETVGTTLLKQSDGFSRLGPTLASLGAYGLAFYFLSLTLREIPTGVAYALWSGIGIVLVAIIAWLVHGQRPDAPATLGMGLILAGVVVMQVWSKVSTH